MKKAIIGLLVIIIIISCGENSNKANAYILYKHKGDYISYKIKKIDVIFFFNEKRVLATNQMVDGTLITVESDDNNAYTRVKCPNTDPDLYGPNYSCKFKKFDN